MPSAIRFLIVSIFFGSSILLSAQNEYSDITISGAMRNVMWDGKLAGIFKPDTISNKTGLYGVGPLSYLKGEILIDDGSVYVSRVRDDGIMSVEIETDIDAPFFVYGNVTQWEDIALPTHVKDIASLEQFIDHRTQESKRPFVFKLQGEVSNASIHVQNLAPGSTVSSPEEAHAGQLKYHIKAENVRIIGFFSTSHQGVFTHHDTFLHMHLLTADERMMGHVDVLGFRPDSMVLYLPVR